MASSLCGFCKQDFGERVLPLLAGVPVCEPCAGRLRSRRLPPWLRHAFVVLFALTVCSLVEGRKYFTAEAAFVRAERGIRDGRYPEASGELARVLATAPESRKALLLKIKADLLSGDVKSAMEGVEKAKARKFEGEPIREVNALLDRVDRAIGEFDQGMRQMKDEKLAEALPHLEKARQLYPEHTGIGLSCLLARGSVQFDRKEWDGFLASEEEAEKLAPSEPQMVAGVASALAAKYASGGGEAFRERALAKLASARGLCRTDEQRKAYEEYRERIEHRLSSREIIDKKEYDRRFRAKS